jgi:hypothetical protein
MSKNDKTTEQLIAEIEALKSSLGVAEQARTAAEERAHALAESQQFYGSTSQEQPTGRTIMVERCINPTVRDAKKLKFIEVEEPTYYYNIQLPPGASGSNGSCLATNGIEYHHGQTVELDPITLAEVKSRVARCWDHEKSIHGENENAYRKHNDPMYHLYANKRR